MEQTPSEANDSNSEASESQDHVGSLVDAGQETIEISKEQRTWAMVCHLASFAICLAIPFGNTLGPLIVWLIKKDEMPLVDDQGKESLNFQITVTIFGLVLAVPIIFPPAICLTIPLGSVLAVAAIVMVIMAAVAANKGEKYRYPVTLRLIK
jgi:uncharacterized Tic20 family protein